MFGTTEEDVRRMESKGDIQGVNAALFSKNSLVQFKAMTAILNMAKRGLYDPSSLAALRGLMENGNKDSVQVAAWMLANLARLGLADATAVPALKRFLLDPNEDLRQATSMAVANIAEWVEMDGETLAMLARLLQDPNLGVRANAVLALGHAAEHGQFNTEIIRYVPRMLDLPYAKVGMLSKMLGDDPNEYLRSVVAYSVGCFSASGQVDPVAVPAMDRMLSRANANSRKNAAIALGRLALQGTFDRNTLSRIANAANDRDPNVSMAAQFAMAAYASRGVAKAEIMPHFLNEAYKMFGAKDDALRSEAVLYMMWLAQAGVVPAGNLEPLKMMMNDPVRANKVRAKKALDLLAGKAGGAQPGARAG